MIDVTRALPEQLGLMSEVGQTRKSGRLEAISGLPSKPDVATVVMLERDGVRLNRLRIPKSDRF
jgi:hypothetical protein